MATRRPHCLGRHPLSACIGVLALAAGLRAEPVQTPAVDQLLASLDRYFETYRVALGALVAEERMVQRTGGRDLDYSNTIRALEVTREIISDVAFIDLPAGRGGWASGIRRG